MKIGEFFKNSPQGVAKDGEFRKNLEETVKKQQEDHQVLLQRDAVYQSAHLLAQEKLAIYAQVIRNATRQAVEETIYEQEDVYNESFGAHNKTLYDANFAHDKMSQDTKTVIETERELEQAEGRVQWNATEADRLNVSIPIMGEDCINKWKRYQQSEVDLIAAIEWQEWSTTWWEGNVTEADARELLVERAGREQKDLVEPLNATRRAAFAKMNEAEEVLRGAEGVVTEKKGVLFSRLERKRNAELDVVAKTGELIRAASVLGETKDQLDGRRGRW